MKFAAEPSVRNDDSLIATRGDTEGLSQFQDSVAALTPFYGDSFYIPFFLSLFAKKLPVSLFSYIFVHAKGLLASVLAVFSGDMFFISVMSL